MMGAGSGTRAFLRLLRSNPVSFAGAVLTTLGFLTFVTVFILSSTGWIGGPYWGMVTFLVLPSVFVVGLLTVPVGLLIYRKRLKERIAQLEGRKFQLARTLSILTVVNIAVVSIAGYQGVHYMDSAEFCGLTCHTVMEPQYIAYLDSPHARVACVDCHIGPGASWFVKAKLDGVRQVFAVMNESYETPIPTPVHSLRPARETCEQCHWPEKFTGDRLVVRQHYRPDETNTPFKNVLVMKTGGVRPDGTASGIHWHMHEGIRIEYVSTDPKRKEIPWVRLVREDGTEEVYVTEGTDPANPPAGEVRTMDCVDCHNQPSHEYHLADDAVDEAIGEGRISPEIPWIKKTALELLEREWKRDTAAREIPEALKAVYAGREPLSEDAAPLLEPAGDAIAAIWLRNVFPEMKVDWGTYRSLTRHRGCHRCHDDGHNTTEGRTITRRCDLCHVMLSFQQQNPEIIDRLGLK